MMSMGKYCKAYTLGTLRKFQGWTEKAENASSETTVEAGKSVEMPRTLDDDSVVYLQENFVVTDGIYEDEHILFDNVTEEWKRFCSDELGFSAPEIEEEPLEE